MDIMRFLQDDVKPEFDYIKLIDLLNKYSSPRNQITQLIKAKKIVRIKKGLYVLGPDFRRPFSLEILANMIYGPSYVSGMWALSYYQLIPERVEEVTSCTPNRIKLFETPVGRFRYTYIPMSQFVLSVDRISVDRERSFLIATPEKSLVELIAKIKEIETKIDLLEWIHSMRIELDSIKKLRIGELQILQLGFPQRQTQYLIDVVRDLKNE